MPELNFHIETAEAVSFAAAPLLALKLRIDSTPAEQVIHSVLLHCQIRIEPAARHYRPDEQDKLGDLFGDPVRWSQTLRSMLWTHTQALVPGFSGSTRIDLPVPCTFDFNIAATKYFAGLADGEVPLCLLFSGTLFHEDDEGRLQVALIPWEKETRFRLPVRVWKDMMDHYYPNQAWLSLRRDLFDRLSAFKNSKGLLTAEHALERLLEDRS
jgi:hypothetical protein